MKNSEIMKRREQLVAIIRTAGKINTEDAAVMFGVSKETIRQDLLYLSNQGIIKKVYGGAVLCENDRIESLPIRETVNFLAKDKIARTAAGCIPEGACIVGMDMGSTVALLGAYLSHRRDLLVVTNSHRVLQSGYGSHAGSHIGDPLFRQGEPVQQALAHALVLRLIHVLPVGEEDLLTV